MITFRMPLALMFGVAVLMFGILVGAIGSHYAVVAPARNAMQVGLQEELDLVEQGAIKSFRTLDGVASIAAQTEFIEFVSRRERMGWLAKRDAERAIGMAKLRMTVDHLILGREHAREKLLLEVEKHLETAGVTGKVSELAEILRREKVGNTSR